MDVHKHDEGCPANHPNSIKVGTDPKTIAATLPGIRERTGIQPDEEAIIAVAFLNHIAGQAVRSEWPTEAAFHKSHRDFIEALKGAAFTPPQGNALCMGLVCSLLADAHIVHVHHDPPGA